MELGGYHYTDRSMKLSVAILVALLAFFAVSAFAQDVAGTGAPQGDEEVVQSRASPDADTVFVFPDADTRGGFYPGNPDTVVLGFRNNGQRPFVFKQIAGSLRYEMDFNYILENYTVSNYGVTVKPGEEYTLLYRFTPHQQLQEGPYGLQFSAIYGDDYGDFETVFFNSTINILEPVSDLTLKDILQYALIIAVSLGAAVGLVRLGSSFGGKRSSSAKKASTGRVVNPDEEWLRGTSADKSLNRRS